MPKLKVTKKSPAAAMKEKIAELEYENASLKTDLEWHKRQLRRKGIKR